MRKVLVANAKGGCGKTTVAITIAASLAAMGQDVILADADRQRSALAWAAMRPGKRSRVLAVDWSKEKAIGAYPKGRDMLVIDGPGGLRSKLAEQLVAESEHIVVPVMPSAFDWRATEDFIKRISKLKPIRKGKAGIYIVANRTRPNTKLQCDFNLFLEGLGLPVVAYISDRVVYSQLAASGETVFDRSGREATDMQAQWHALVERLRD